MFVLKGIKVGKSLTYKGYPGKSEIKDLIKDAGELNHTRDVYKEGRY